MKMERMVNMSWWKNCFLVATGVVAGALLYEQVMNDEDDKRDVDEDDDEEIEQDGIEILLSKVRCEAMVAMAKCRSYEEREAVYAQLKETVQEMQDALAEKGEAMIEQLRAEAERQGREDEPDGVESIKEAMQQIKDSLEDALESLKPAAPEPLA